MDKQAAVTLPEQTYIRLQALSRTTGRPASAYIQAAVEEYLDDMEDVTRAEQVLVRVRSGQEITHSLDMVERSLGLAD